MAYGTTNVDTIQSSTSGTPVVFKDGNGTQIGTLCRAWVNFVGGASPTVTASFNVSSITRNGTGDHTVNFTTALPDNKYSFTANAGAASATSFLMSQAQTAPSTTAIRFYTYNFAGALADVPYNCVSVFR
jgi:hypothetical protein